MVARTSFASNDADKSLIAHTCQWGGKCAKTLKTPGNPLLNRYRSATHSIGTSAYRPTPLFLRLLEPSWPKTEGVQNTCTTAHSTEYPHKGLDFFAASK